MKSLFKKFGILAGATFVVTVSFFAGLYVNAERSKLLIAGASGTSILSLAPSELADNDFSLFWRAWQVLDDRYVPTGVASTSLPSSRDKVYGAIKGLAESYGDPFTTFLTPKEASNLTTDLSGSLEGIGAILSIKEGVLTVVSLIKDSPAERSGLLAGDQIIKVDNVETGGLEIDKDIQMIRGKKGTTVTLTIQRNGRSATFPVTIVRDTITTPVVETKAYPDGVYVIKVASFTSNSPELFRKALRDYVNSGNQRLIIDMRNNSGGYLEAAVDMASWFLPYGYTVVREDYGGGEGKSEFRSKGYSLLNPSARVVVLINENTASAAEIFAGALKDHGKAVLVGTKTYGKGSVQELVPISEDTILKVTIAQWLTPNGTSISLSGIKPDYDAPMTLEDIKASKDPQLDKALEIVKTLR